MPGRFDKLLRRAKPQDHDPSLKHREAFCLMWYSCPCSHRERIWNSRDGVTPFGTACPSCDRPSLRHVDFGLDQYAPEHKPTTGQRVWVDMTRERAEKLAKRQIELFKQHGHAVHDGAFQAIADDLMGTRHGGGAPDLRVHGYAQT